MAGSWAPAALLDLGVESGEVELVELAELGPVSQIHLVEPLHQLVGYVVAEPVVEGLGQPRGNPA